MAGAGTPAAAGGSPAAGAGTTTEAGLPAAAEGSPAAAKTPAAAEGSPAAGARAPSAAAEAVPGKSGLLSRRAVLGGAGVAAIATTIPAAFRQPARAAAGSGHGPRVVIVGSGLAGLGCAYRLWRRHGIRSEIYEYNPVRAGGRVHTLHGFFDAGQYAEQHGEFISSEHTVTRRLTASFGLTLDNVNRYPPHTHPQDERLRFGGRFWRQAALNREWRDWAFKLFYDAANNKAPWPTLHNRHTAWGWRWDHMPATQWIEENIRGGLQSDFGRLCVAVLLDEYGGPADEQSALNLIYLLGLYDSSPSGLQPRRQPQLSGTDEKWHIRGGNDQLISGLVGRLPAGTVRLGERLVALRARGHGRYTAAFANGKKAASSTSRSTSPPPDQSGSRNTTRTCGPHRTLTHPLPTPSRTCSRTMPSPSQGNGQHLCSYPCMLGHGAGLAERVSSVRTHLPTVICSLI